VLLLVGYGTQEPDRSFTASPYAHGDGVYYYAYLRSLLFDRDVEFTNDYALLGNQLAVGRVPLTGRPGNFATIGPALSWLPLALVGRVVVATGRALGGFVREASDGTGPLFQQIVFFSSVLAGFGAALLTYRAARVMISERAALMGTLGATLATPLVWYMVRQACYSHAASALAVAAFVVVWFEGQEGRTRRGWFLLGVLLGVAMLMRTQDAVNVVFPLGEWLLLLWAALRRPEHRRRQVLGLLGAGGLFVLGLFIGFAPQMIAWQKIYGYPIVVPLGPSFMLFGSSRWSEVLFSSRAGLFAWHPIYDLAVAGLVGLALARGRGPLVRRFALFSLIAFFAQAYVNGAVVDWWGGWSFGGRRFVSCTVYLGVGLAAALEAAVRLVERRPRLVVRAAAVGLLGVFVLFNGYLMMDFRDYRALHGVAQPMKPLWKTTFVRVVDGLYEVTGNWGSAPASWLLAWRARVSPQRYDTASPYEVLAAGPKATLPFTDERTAGGGFGEATNHAGRPCRWVREEPAHWMFALRTVPGDVRGVLSLAAAEPGTRVQMWLGRERLLDQVIGPGWSDRSFTIPRRSLAVGMNYLRIEQQVPSHLSPIGRTGRTLGWDLGAESAGYLAGNHAALFMAGEKIPVVKRGITLATFAPDRPRLIERESFDTFARATETDDFVRAVERLAPGTIAVVVALDDASSNWSPAADQALAALGGKESLKGHYRESYALIGVKGAHPGQALEQRSAAAVVTLGVGRPPPDQQRGVAWANVTLAVDPKK
jgi:hypothetical protein